MNTKSPSRLAIAVVIASIVSQVVLASIATAAAAFAAHVFLCPHFGNAVCSGVFGIMAVLGIFLIFTYGDMAFRSLYTDSPSPSPEPRKRLHTPLSTTPAPRDLYLTPDMETAAERCFKERGTLNSEPYENNFLPGASRR